MPFPGFRLREAYRFAAEHGLADEAGTIRAMPIHPRLDRNKRHVPRKAAFVELFEKKGLMDQFIEQHWPLRYTPAGERRRQSYLDDKALHDQLCNGEIDEDAMDEAEEHDEDAPSDAELAAFAMEAHLRDFMTKNLSKIPIAGNNLRLYVASEGV